MPGPSAAGTGTSTQTGTDSGTNRRSTASDRCGVSATPWLPIGPSPARRRKNTYDALAFMTRRASSGFAASHARIDCIETASRAYGPHSIAGESAASQALRDAIVEEAGRTRPVLVVGQRGTRRRDVARAVHYGVEGAGPFLFMHCASLSTDSLEPEFFGCAGGEHPDCVGSRAGLLGLAAGGTLVLEEIEVLPLSLQERLGDAMLEGTFRRLGCDEDHPLEARIVATSQHDQAMLRKRGSLAPKLLAALGESSIEVPSLADRRADLPVLSRQVLDRIAGRSTSKMLAPEVQ